MRRDEGRRRVAAEGFDHDVAGPRCGGRRLRARPHLDARRAARRHPGQRAAHRRPTAARAAPRAASSAARRQHTPRSPWLSMTRQNRSHRQGGVASRRLSKAARISAMDRARTAPATPDSRPRAGAARTPAGRSGGAARPARRLPLLRRQGGVLYVGKARNLKKRVSSYFQKDHGGTRIGHMVARIARLETTVVRTEAEALLLENNLIKTLNPKFNILFRDDKSYPYLKLVSHPFPQGGLLPRRGRPQAPLLRPLPGRLGGEGDDPADAEGVPAAHLRGHGLRQPLAALPAVPDPPLLGPCVGLVAAGRLRTRRAATPSASCSASTQEVMDDLQRADDGARRSAGLRAGGRAAQPIGALSRVLHQQSVDASSLSARRRATSTSWRCEVPGGRACVNLAMVRGSRHLGDRAYFPSHVDDATALQRRRRRRTRRAAIAPEVAGARGLHRPALPRPGGAAAAGAEPRGRCDTDRRR